ncbi:MAG: hypothetical protein RR614_02265 [Eubacterium sp.]
MCGKDVLILVNASNSLTAVMWNMIPWDWERLKKISLDAIMRTFMNEGYSGEQFETYLNLAGKQIELTKTHGRRPVAALNRRAKLLLRIPVALDEKKRFQPYHTDCVNNISGTAGGFTSSGKPSDLFERDMKRLGIRKDKNNGYF